MRTARLRSRGFTLMEVMITIAIIGILVAVALPSYRDYARRGALPEATGALARLRVKLEQYYQDHRNYGVDSCGQGSFSLAEAGKFTVSCSVSDAGQKYLMTATGDTGTVAAGHTYTIDESNAQRTTAFKGSPVAKSCWVMRGDEC